MEYLIAAVVVVALLLLMRQLTSKPDIGSDEAKKRVADGALLVDVRSPGEFARGHIDGAVNIPVGELGKRLSELGDEDSDIVLYCASGARSTRALSMLRERGYKHVANLGAMSRWQSA